MSLSFNFIIISNILLFNYYCNYTGFVISLNIVQICYFLLHNILHDSHLPFNPYPLLFQSHFSYCPNFLLAASQKLQYKGSIIRSILISSRKKKVIAFFFSTSTNSEENTIQQIRVNTHGLKLFTYNDACRN